MVPENSHESSCLVDNNYQVQYTLSNKSNKHALKDINFGEGRQKKLHYYQYSSASSDIYSMKSELNNDEINVEFNHSVPNNLPISRYKPKFSLKRLLKFCGPGFLMSVAYIDPGNLESDVQAGAIAGYDLIWVLFWSTILGFFIQCLSVRLGVVTGKNLAELCRYEYPYHLTIFLWIMTQLAIIGSDIQEVFGSAIAYNLLFGIPYWLGCVITVLDTFIFLFLNKFGLRILESFFILLISIMSICFLIEFFILKPSMLLIIKGWFVPICKNNSIEQAVGMIGAVIMPHNLLLHSALVQTRNIQRNNKYAIKEGIYYNIIESAVTLFLSFLINLFIISIVAKGFYGYIDPTSIGLKEFGFKLEDKFGKIAKIIWAVGLLAAGQSSTMTGTFTGFYAMNGFLNIKLQYYKQSILTRSISLIPSLTIAILAAKNFDKIDELLNVQMSIQLPFALLPLLFLNCDHRIMGIFKLTFKWKLFFFIISFGIIGINIYLIVTFMLKISIYNIYLKIMFICISLIVYVGLCFWIIIDYIKQQM